MKLNITVILIFATIAQISAISLVQNLVGEVGKSILDEQLQDFLSNLRSTLRTGNSSLGIPVLDPYEIEYQKLNSTGDLIIIDGELRNGTVTGLSNYTVNEATFNLIGLTMTLNMTWPEIAARSLYAFDAEFKGTPVYGKGDVAIEIFNFTLAANVEFGLTSGKILIQNLSTHIRLERINLDSTGLYNNQAASETIDSIISNTGHHFVNNIPSEIQNMIDEKLKITINSYLSDLTLLDILNIIG